MNGNDATLNDFTTQNKLCKSQGVIHITWLNDVRGKLFRDNKNTEGFGKT